MTDTPHNPGPAIDRPLIVIGAGDHARVLIDLVRWRDDEVACIVDRDATLHGRTVEGIAVRGGYDVVADYDASDVLLVNAVGSIDRPIARREVFEHFKQSGYRFATLIHPSAVIAGSARLGEGAQVMAGAVIQTTATIGDNALINTRASIDHDCRIGHHCHLAPGVTLSGQVRIGDATHIGAGATIIEYVRIGREALIGAGAVVVGDLDDGVTAMGVPARVCAEAGRAGADGR